MASDNVLLDAIHSNRRAMSFAVDELGSISALLYEMNMERLSDRIDAVAESIARHSKNVSDAFGADLNERLAEGQAMTGAILLGLLHNCEKASKAASA